jgi:hypothetical protein
MLFSSELHLLRKKEEGAATHSKGVGQKRHFLAAVSENEQQKSATAAATAKLSALRPAAAAASAVATH